MRNMPRISSVMPSTFTGRIGVPSAYNEMNAAQTKVYA